MIVRRFLYWMRTAPAGERAAATSALARAYLYSDLSDNDRAAAERAMTVLVDDPSPLVRQALARALSASPQAPHAVIHALAADHRDIAALVLARSPLFIDAELVDFVATGGSALQAAIASRAPLQCPVAAAIAEVAGPEACLVAIENPDAGLSRRHRFAASSNGSVTSAPSARRCSRAPICRLPPAKHCCGSYRTCSSILSLSAIGWGAAGPTDRPGGLRESHHCDCGGWRGWQYSLLIHHLRVSGQLTTGFTLRALLSGNIGLFEDTLAELSGLPLHRVQALLDDRGGAGFRAVFEKAGLPRSCYAAFREALAALREAQANGECSPASRLQRRVVERVLTSCKGADPDEVEPLLILLRRFAAEAAREDAYAYCDELTYGPAGGERVAA